MGTALFVVSRHMGRPGRDGPLSTSSEEDIGPRGESSSPLSFLLCAHSGGVAAIAHEEKVFNHTIPILLVFSRRIGILFSLRFLYSFLRSVFLKEKGGGHQYFTSVTQYLAEY